MKRKKIITMFILLASSLFVFSSTTNNKSIANANLHFQLNEGVNLNEPLLIDVSSIHLVSQQAGEKLALSICDNLLDFSYVGANTFSLKLNQNPISKIQSIQDWNKYISTLFPRFEKLLLAINK